MNSNKNHLSDRINLQVQDFIALLEKFNGKLPPEQQRPLESYLFLRDFFPAFITDRNKRAAEVNSVEYKSTLKMAEEILPMNTFTVMCMDGRIKMIHAFGFSAGIGGSVRVPGGLLKEYVRGEDGELKLDADSNFAQLLDGAIAKDKEFAEVFDSHWACAARKGEELSKGGSPKDGGLYSDVLHKREMVRATRRYVLEKYGDSKQMALIQTVFNPITGYMYMGLETEKALGFVQSFSKEADTIFSKEVLKELINEGLIIATGKLIENPVVRKEFKANFFEVKWKNDYVKTAKAFWTGLSKMKVQLLPIFEKSLTHVYPELGLEDKKTKKELEERAMLLMCNAYNGYLHNKEHVELEYLEVSDSDYETLHRYEYDSHLEEGIKVSEGGYPPYDIPMFVIFSGDEVNMPASIELASGLVRNNRLAGRVKDASKNYITFESFAKAPVPIVMQEIIRDQRLTGDDWVALESIDWSDLPVNWDTMSPEEFAEYVEEKGKLVNSLTNGLERLRRKMAIIFARTSVTAAHLIDQYKVALPVICDKDRETHAVIPFAKLGY